MDSRLNCGGPETRKSTPVTIATIFRSLSPTFPHDHQLSYRQTQALHSIVQCRTAALGGHLWRCSACSHEMPVYNSCLDRHCPQCQGPARYRWVAKRMEEVLNTHYFHIVFTLPHCLNPLLAANPSLLALLFRAASQTLLLFGRDPKYLGGELGILAVLHTWDQKLQGHYHLHCIVPGGALSQDNQSWLTSKSQNFLFPVHAMAKTFRRLYWHGSKPLKTGKIRSKVIRPKHNFKGLKEQLQEGSLQVPGFGPGLPKNLQVNHLERSLYGHPWVVYAKRPFGGPKQVIKYLGNYTHRIAISNHRIVHFEHGRVTFSWKDRRNGKAPSRRLLTLSAEQFALRFLQHVLPRGFMKIRAYGFLANCQKKKKLQQCNLRLGSAQLACADARKDPALNHPVAIQCNFDEPGQRVCPNCHKPALTLLRPIFANTPNDLHETHFHTLPSRAPP